MKQFISLFLALVMSLSMVACSPTETPSSSTAPTSSSETPASSSEEAPASSEVASEPEVAETWSPMDENGLIKRDDRDATGVNGVVSTGKYEASQIGVDIIEQGGNAIDAAVAVGFALGVCEPQSSGMGGGGFMTLNLVGEEPVFIDFREIAPRNATPEMWELDSEGNVVNNEKAAGGKSIGVPGEVKGLLYVLEEYGTMTREEVMRPAIELAENGYTVSNVMNGDISDNYEAMQKYTATGDIYLKDGYPYEVGDTITNPDLAKTLEIIVEEGEDGFYTGEVAQMIVDSVVEAGGVMTMEDLAEYEITITEPVSGTYRGYEILSAPPPSSGGSHVVQILNILENFDIGSMEVNSPEYIHLFSEAMKMAFADRWAYMADPNFVDVPVSGITSKEYAAMLAEKIDLTASNLYTEDDAWAYNDTPQESNETTHYSILDKEGNMIAVTKTVNKTFGSGVVAEGTGILMNNQMNDFSLSEDSVNAVEPYKKPLSSMSPTLILKDGESFMSLGAPGGTMIFNGVTQVISKVIDHDMDIQEAIDSPRITDDYGEIWYEERLDYPDSITPETLDALSAMGHTVISYGEWAPWPCIQGVMINDDGELRGGADPRRDGKALGY